jgi:uncharacterized delta-60 repeat protein
MLARRTPPRGLASRLATVVLLTATLVTGQLAGGAHTALAAPGDLDPSFGTGGTVTLAWPGDPPAQPNDLLTLPSGKTLVSALLSNGDGTYRAGLAQLQADGTPDPAFGTGGYSVPDIPALAGVQVTALPDGKLLLAGTVEVDPSIGRRGLLLARLATDGTLDPTFGSGGTTTALFPQNVSPVRVVLGDDGRLHVGLELSTEGSGGFGLARFNTAGALDTAYGDAGLLTVHLSLFDDLFDLVRAPDGKLVTIGLSISSAAVGAVDYGLARFLPDGSPDPSFGTGGTVLQDVGQDNQFPEAVFPQPDGSILLAGNTHLGSDPELATTLVRFHPDGTLDTSYGNGGQAVYNPTIGVPDSLVQRGATMAPRDKVAGVVLSGEFSLTAALVRFDAATGATDSSFGTAGAVPLGATFTGLTAGTPDGKLVVALPRTDDAGLPRAEVKRFVGDPPLTPLTLTATCHRGRPRSLEWAVRNPNDVPVTFYWTTADGGQAGRGTAPAGGTATFTTRRTAGSTTVKLFVDGQVVATADPCTT